MPERIVPEKTVSTKYFHFRQNNSGCVGFSIGDKVDVNVVIESTDADHANQLAENIGIYFDGCNSGQDCPCCGDRWHRQWSDEEGTDIPAIYGDPVAECGSSYIVYHFDGTVERSKHRGKS